MNPKTIFGDIANQATQRDQETFEQWYLQTYQQKFSWEALFAWKEANKLGLTYKRKKNIKYNEGLGKDGQVFNTDDNLLKYSTVEFEDGVVELDTILTFARKLDPVENDFNPNLWAADIEQAMDTEVAYKRNKILEIINKGTFTTIQGKKVDNTNALQIHDEIMDKIYENGFTLSETIVLGSADFIRGIRNKLQLQLGTNDQINSVITISGAMKLLKEQHTIWFLKNYQLLIKMVQKEQLNYYQMVLMQLPLSLAKNMTLLFYAKKIILR
ncbi:hypothetical protein [Spiroplasma endosymbiont of Ammophila pubescens]|uniref:hypothetical protein n=1 Tax=Spiroplasma endosymbiont of Ammophila pubescens TaxID=3066315 RepID=UPI0032B2B7C3